MGRFDDFLATRRSVETAKIYRRCVLQFTKDPDGFLELAEKDRGAAEKAIIDYFVAAKTAGATRRGKYHAIKSFLTFYDVESSGGRSPRSCRSPGRSPWTGPPLGTRLSSCSSSPTFVGG